MVVMGSSFVDTNVAITWRAVSEFLLALKCFLLFCFSDLPGRLHCPRHGIDFLTLLFNF